MTQMIPVDNITHFCYKCGNLTTNEQFELLMTGGVIYCNIADKDVSAKHTCKNWTRCK